MSEQITSPDTVTASSTTTTTTAAIEPHSIEAAVSPSVVAATPVAPVAAAAPDKVETVTSTGSQPKPSFAALASALKSASEKMAKEKVSLT